jgi:hypothetical protein
MKGWPPPESLWKKVAEDLPPGTDMPTLQAKICTVVSVYLNDESGKADIYAEIHKQLRGLEFEQLDRALGSLRALPSAFRPSIVDQVDLQSLYDLRTYSKGQITRHKYNSAKRNSDGRLYFNLLWILTETGLPLSDSDGGPTARVFKALTDCILQRPLTNRGIKDIVSKEKRRRAKAQH